MVSESEGDLHKGHAADHWRRQSLACGGSLLDPEASPNIYVLDKSTSHATVGSMLRTIGVDPATQPAYRFHYPPQMLPSAGAMGSKQPHHETFSDQLRDDYWTPELARRVLEYYAVDYKAFDLPVPRWAADMVGIKFVHSQQLRLAKPEQ